MKGCIRWTDQVMGLHHIIQENRTVVDVHEKMFKLTFCKRQPCCALTTPALAYR
jgi:hypothetical protein